MKKKYIPALLEAVKTDARDILTLSVQDSSDGDYVDWPGK